MAHAGAAATTLPCQEHEPELWFAEHPTNIDRAKALCATCPVMQSCLAGALERHEAAGVWGGELIVAGEIIAFKRGRGRPRKHVA